MRLNASVAPAFRYRQCPGAAPSAIRSADDAGGGGKGGALEWERDLRAIGEVHAPPGPGPAPLSGCVRVIMRIRVRVRARGVWVFTCAGARRHCGLSGADAKSGPARRPGPPAAHSAARAGAATPPAQARVTLLNSNLGIQFSVNANTTGCLKF